MTRAEMETMLDNLDRRTHAIEQILPTLATKDDLKAFATKEDLKAFATKEDLKAFATKEDLKAFATKEDLKAFPTRDEFKSALDDLRHHTTILYESLRSDVQMLAGHIGQLISNRNRPE